MVEAHEISVGVDDNLGLFVHSVVFDDLHRRSVRGEVELVDEGSKFLAIVGFFSDADGIPGKLFVGELDHVSEVSRRALVSNLEPLMKHESSITASKNS